MVDSNTITSVSASASTSTPEPSSQELNFPEAVISVSVWFDPVLEELGYDPRSEYVERFWLPILGPSSLFLLRRLVIELEKQPAGFAFQSAEWAGALGLGMRGGKHGPFWRSIDRVCRFGAAKRNGALMVVRTKLAPLTIKQIERLPTDLGLAHQAWISKQPSGSKTQTEAVCQLQATSCQL